MIYLFCVLPPPLIPLGSAEPPRQKRREKKGESRVERGNRERRRFLFILESFAGKREEEAEQDVGI